MSLVTLESLAKTAIEFGKALQSQGNGDEKLQVLKFAMSFIFSKATLLKIFERKNAEESFTDILQKEFVSKIYI